MTSPADVHPWTLLRYALALWLRLFRLGLRQWMPVYAVFFALVVVADLGLR